MRLIGAASTVFVLLQTFFVSGLGPSATAQQLASQSRDADERAGRAIFRYDTFGDEQLWTGVLRMHEVIATVDPATALAVGLKVDIEALPPKVIAALRAGRVNLADPAVTIELLRLWEFGATSTRRGTSPAWASRAPCATLRSTTSSRRALAGGWTDGPTPI
jgi:hypothetical protein